MVTVLKMAAATLLPVLLAAVLYLLEKKTRYGRLSYPLRQTITGLLFGGVAVCGEHHGTRAEETDAGGRAEAA